MLILKAVLGSGPRTGIPVNYREAHGTERLAFALAACHASKRRAAVFSKGGTEYSDAPPGRSQKTNEILPFSNSLNSVPTVGRSGMDCTP